MDTIVAVALVLALLVVTGIAAGIMARRGRDRVNKMKIRYITRLENTDPSIQDEVKYLKRTNCLDTNFEPLPRI